MADARARLTPTRHTFFLLARRKKNKRTKNIFIIWFSIFIERIWIYINICVCVCVYAEARARGIIHFENQDKFKAHEIEQKKRREK